MRSRVFLVSAVAMVVSALAVSIGVGAQQKMVLRAADDHPMDYPTTQGLKYIADTVEKATGGRIKIEIYPSAQLGSEKKTIEMTQMGALDINRVSCSPLMDFVPALSVYGLPYIFRGEDHAWKVLNGPIGKKLLRELETRQLVGLCYYDSGARSFYTTKKPINSPDDLKGLKIRTQKSRTMMAVMEAMGATPVPMEFEEVYSALQTGVIDGAENNPPSFCISTPHYEVCKYYSLDEHVRVPEVVLVSLITWNKLSPEDQKILRDAAEASVAVQRKLWGEYEEIAMKRIRDKGIQIIYPDKSKFQAVAIKAWEEARKDFGDLIDAICATK